MKLTNICNFFALITLPVVCLTGCGQKDNEATIFNSGDYSTLSELKQTVSQQYIFKEFVDDTLGFKKYTFMTFVGDHSVYDQIALECIHKGTLKINPQRKEFELERFTKSVELSQCIKDVVNRPISIDTALYSSILGINYDDQQLKNLITEAKKDNILNIHEYLQIGILANQKWKEAPPNYNEPKRPPELKNTELEDN